jgi:hypothetical protein
MDFCQSKTAKNNLKENATGALRFCPAIYQIIYIRKAGQTLA